MAIIEDIKELKNKSEDYLANVPTLKDILKPIFGSNDERKEVCNVRTITNTDSTRKDR
jgi:hypothetical protein